MPLWIFDSGPNRKDIKYEPVAADAVHAYESLGSTAVGADRIRSRAAARVCDSAHRRRDVRPLRSARAREDDAPAVAADAAVAAPLFGQDRAVGCSRINTGLCNALAERRALSCPTISTTLSRSTARAALPLLWACSGLSPPVTWEHDGGHLPFEPGGRVLAVRTADGQPAHVETWVQIEASEDHIVLDPHEAVGRRELIERWRSSVTVFGVVAVLLRTTSRG